MSLGRPRMPRPFRPGQGCSRRRWHRRSRFMHGPGCPDRHLRWAWAPTSLWCGSLTAMPPGECWSWPAPWSWGPTTGAGWQAPSRAPWAFSSGAPAQRSTPRPSFAAPRRCAASRPTLRRDSTSATSSAISRIMPGSCSGQIGWRSSFGMARGESPRRAAAGSRRRSSPPPGTSRRLASASARCRRAAPSRSSAQRPSAPRARCVPRRSRKAWTACSLRRSWTPPSCTGCCTWRMTGRTAGARRTWMRPRRLRGMRPSRSGRRGPSAAWQPGRPSCSPSSAWGRGCRASRTCARSEAPSPPSCAS